MDEQLIKLLLFEIVPIERLHLTEVADFLGSVTKALPESGLVQAKSPKWTQGVLFEIKDGDRVAALTQKVFGKGEEELVWLATNYFSHLLILPSKYDVLFGMISCRDPESKGPSERTAVYVSQEVGNYTYTPAIARLLCAGALRDHAFEELGNRINCKASFPIETALAGDVVFLDSPIKYDITVVDESTGMRWVPVSVLSPKKLLTQQIVDLLKSDSDLGSIEIAKAMPWQIIAPAFSEDQTPFSLFNHWSLRAKRGTASELLSELLTICLHLSWPHARDHGDQLPRSDALRYAFAQSNRWRQVEEKERALRHSLAILQKRHPSRHELIDWEVNNVYANLVRYSPVYLAWTAYLQSYIQGGGSSVSALIGRIDWDSLSDYGIASASEAQQITELLTIDPASMLTKMRVVVEKAITHVFRASFPGHSDTLAGMSQRLNQAGIFPAAIYVYLNTVRLMGNVGAHQGAGSKDDVEAVCPCFVRVMEWFVDDVIKRGATAP